MASIPIIDSHIHLWPEDMCHLDGHSWMTPGMPLAKGHVLEDYIKAVDSRPHLQIEGLVFIETDVAYTVSSEPLEIWAEGSLRELNFVREIVEAEDDRSEAPKLLGVVLWAPMQFSTSILKDWLRLVEKHAGVKTWSRIKGFRYLLQDISSRGEFKDLVLSASFIENLRLLGRRGISFDVGIDQCGGGIWQLDTFASAIREAHKEVFEHEQTTFIINHLCKPDLRAGTSNFSSWKMAISEFASFKNCYMKLSGLLGLLPDDVDEIESAAEYLQPWVTHIFVCFGSQRVMFGSDWPVCNLNKHWKERSWSIWYEILQKIFQKTSSKPGVGNTASIWRNTAVEAYRLHS